MIGLAFVFAMFGLGTLFMSIGISGAGESEARMLREWRRVGWALFMAAVVVLAIALLGAR